MSMPNIAIVDHLDCFAERFEGVDLHAKRVNKAEFEECTFVSCDFSETFFYACRFIDCHFENCNLSVMKLTDTKFSNTAFTSCKMNGIDWCMANWKSLLNPLPLKFDECIVDDSNFFGLFMEGLVMKACRAKEVDFRSALLSHANFAGTDFKGALFHQTHLENANFTDAINTRIDLRTNHLKGAIFSRFEALGLLEGVGIVLVD